MSREDSPDLLKTWVIVDQKPNDVIQQTKDTSAVQEVAENELHDSDTDSISVISSYKTDEEEVTFAEILAEKDEEERNDAELDNKEPAIVSTQSGPEFLAATPNETAGIEKIMYLATSAVCAIIFVGFSIAVQNYIQNASNIDNYEPDQFFPQVQNLKSEKILNEHEPARFHVKRKNQLKLEEFEHKLAKLRSDNEFHDKIASSVRDNDPKVEGNLQSIYKPNKNKNVAAKCNKENCDLPKRPIGTTISPEETNPKTTSDEADDEACEKKLKQLKIKEDYLREKEKFLIEKEHNLLKQEIKLNKEKQQHTKNRQDKNTFNRKGKKYNEESREESDSSEKKDKFKQKKHANEKNHKKKYKEDKKKEPRQKRLKFSDEQGKKRNTSGQWYMSLHEARDNLRQKKRAHFKKNKAHWYFQWMVDRARLRVK